MQGLGECLRPSSSARDTVMLNLSRSQNPSEPFSRGTPVKLAADPLRHQAPKPFSPSFAFLFSHSRFPSDMHPLQSTGYPSCHGVYVFLFPVAYPPYPRHRHHRRFPVRPRPPVHFFAAASPSTSKIVIVTNRNTPEFLAQRNSIET